MSNKIQIGEREYEFPFVYNESEQSVYSTDGWRVCEVFNGAFGNFITDSLNARARDGWIPISERLPTEKGFYYVAYRNGTENFSNPMWFSPKQGKFILSFPMVDMEEGCFDELIAWRPLPDAFVPDTEKEEK